MQTGQIKTTTCLCTSSLGLRNNCRTNLQVRRLRGQVRFRLNETEPLFTKCLRNAELKTHTSRKENQRNQEARQGKQRPMRSLKRNKANMSSSRQTALKPQQFTWLIGCSPHASTPSPTAVAGANRQGARRHTAITQQADRGHQGSREGDSPKRPDI